MEKSPENERIKRAILSARIEMFLQKMPAGYSKPGRHFFNFFFILKILETLSVLDVQQGFVNQANQAVDVVFVRHFHGGVHVAQRQ